MNIYKHFIILLFISIGSLIFYINFFNPTSSKTFYSNDIKILMPVNNNNAPTFYIDGEVTNNGEYNMTSSTKLKDAINLAGGLNINFNQENLDFNRKILNNEYIFLENKINVFTTSDNNDTLININTANLYELTKLNGIGDKIASNIINYRTENGDFKNIYEIKRVNKIGDKLFEKIKDFITVGG